MITRSSLTHLAKSADSYAYDDQTLHIRFRSAKGEVDKVTLWIGDPYTWAEGGLDGGNLGGSDAHGWIGGTEVPMLREGCSEHHDHWFASYVPPKKRARYGFILHGKDGEKLLFGEKHCVDIREVLQAEVELSNLSNFFCFPYINPVDVLKTPTWVRDTVWYQIFPERFYNGRPDISPTGVEPWGNQPTSRNFMGAIYGASLRSWTICRISGSTVSISVRSLLHQRTISMTRSITTMLIPISVVMKHFGRW